MLKKYNPSEKGKELIAVLFPLSQQDREKNILAYWKRYPQEMNAVMDGFHYLIQEVVESRTTDGDEIQLGLTDDLLYAVFKKMHEESKFFSYENGAAFLEAINKYQPSIFNDPQKIGLLFNNAAASLERDPSLVNASVELSEDQKSKLIKICQSAARSYDEISRIQPSIRRSKSVIAEFKETKDPLARIDLNLAKETYVESTKVFKEHSQKISKGLEFVSEIYQTHKDRVFILQIYLKYLAKVLASRESLQPTEKYVLRQAIGPFVLEEPDFQPNDQQLQQGITRITLMNEYRNKLAKHVTRLECRYQKRRLMAQLKEGVPDFEIIKKLIKIFKADSEDIRTGIFLARLLGQYAASIKQPEKRKYLKEEALKYCHLAYSKIDDYLKLQEIKKDRERDVQRAGFVKTINVIKLPLIQKRK